MKLLHYACDRGDDPDHAAGASARPSPIRRSSIRARRRSTRPPSKEGMVVSFDTGPTWANWAAQFAAFKKRYPAVEMTYNDLGSAATVVALDKARNRPQADTAYYFAASAVDAVKKDVVASFKPVNFDKLPDVFSQPEGKWFTIHSLTIAFVVNTKLVKNVPQSWADLLKPEYKNAVVYLDPRSTGVGQVLTFAATYAHGGDMTTCSPASTISASCTRPATCCASSARRLMRSSSRAKSRSGSPTRMTGSRPSTPTGSATSRRRDPEGSLGRGAVRHQPRQERARTRTPASCGSTSS